eukprot:15338827-Ditylum_brightwellii.AAC.1
MDDSGRLEWRDQGSIECSNGKNHIVSVCPKLAGMKYTKHHNDVACYICWNLLNEWGIEVHAQWWKYEPIASILDGDTTITWDLKIITNKSRGVKNCRQDYKI